MNLPIERYPTPLAMPFSKAVRANGFLFLSGVLPMDAAGGLVQGDIALQTRVVIERIGATLAELDATLGDVVKVTVFLGDLADFAAFNAEYARHFGASLPARSTVGAQLYGGARIEIEAVAVVPPPRF
jgi:reactive intermediate/imine deaminase